MHCSGCFSALGISVHQRLSTSVLWCPWCLSALCFGTLGAPEPQCLVLRRPQCLDTPCIAASVPWCLRALDLSPSMLQSLDASVLQRPLCLVAPCIGASVLRRLRYPRVSAPRCFGTLGAQTLPTSVSSVPQSTLHVLCRMLPPHGKHLLCVRCLGMQHASSTLGVRRSAQSVQRSSHKPCKGGSQGSVVRLPQPAQLSPLQHWEPRPPPFSAFKPFAEHTLCTGSSPSS
ncbi:UNVERIFIED_CONTAM: hypothetical protein FKN15_025743 [Acipenser sinensis]